MNEYLEWQLMLSELDKASVQIKDDPELVKAMGGAMLVLAMRKIRPYLHCTECNRRTRHHTDE